MITKIKTLLGLTDSDTPDEAEELRNEKLAVIADNTTRRLKTLLGGVSEVPEELTYIIIEVSIKRFNRIGSEGVSSHGVEGETMSWSDNDFDEFTADISAWRDTQSEDVTTKGKIRFI